MSSTGGDEDIRGRHRHADGARPASEVEARIPYRTVDGKHGEHSLEIFQYLSVPVTRGRVPQLQPDDRAPASIAGLERTHHPFAYRSVAIRPHACESRRKNRSRPPSSALAALARQFLNAQQVFAT